MEDFTIDIGDVPGGSSQGTTPVDEITLDKVPPRIDTTIAERRAVEAHVGLGEKSPGLPALSQAISSGTEENLRRMHAAQEELASKSRRLNVIRDLASRSTGPITEELANTIMTVGTAKDTVDPNVVWEKNFARRFINEVGILPGWAIDHSLKDDEESSLDTLNAAEDMITRKKIAQHRKENLEAEFAGEGGFEKTWDYAKTFIPLLSGYKLNQVLKQEAPGITVLPGETIGEKVAYLHQLPPNEFREKFDQALDQLKASNPLDAIRFAEAVDHYSASDSAFDNAMGAIDLVTTVPFGMAAKAIKGAKAVGAVETGAEALGKAASRGAMAEAANNVRLSFRNIVRKAVKGATEGDSVDVGKALAGVGDIERAAAVNAEKAAATGFVDVNPTRERNWLFRAVPTMFNPEAVGDASMSMAREASQRLISDMKRRADGLWQAIARPSAVVRLTPEAERVGVEETVQAIKNQYNYLQDTILDVSHEVVKQENTVKNVNTVSVFFGDKDGKLFTSPEAAWQYGDFYGLPDKAYRIEQIGTGYALKMTKVIDETTPGVRRAMAIETTNQTPRSMATAMLGAFRSADDIVSKTQRDARNVALHSTQEVHKWVKEAAAEIGSLKKGEAKALRTILEHNRDYIDPDTGQRGQFFGSVSELEQSYDAVHGRLPTEREVKAYFAYVQLNDFDWIARNLTIYRDKARQGIENMRLSINVKDKDGKLTVADTSLFDGKVVDELPWTNVEDAGVWVHHNDPDNMGTFLPKSLASKEEVERLVKEEGYKIIQLANPVEKPFKELAKTERTINFVLTRDWKSQPLDWNQLPYKPGGHVSYQGEHFVKQPIIKRVTEEVKDADGKVVDTKLIEHTYEGDRAIFGFATEAEATKYAKRMEEARQLMNSGGDLGGYLRRNLPYSENEFKALFEPVTDEKTGEVIKEAYLHKDDPILFTRSGERATDKEVSLSSKYENFKDDIRSSYNLYNEIDKKFAGERNLPLYTVREGTEGQPLYSLEKAAVIDPLTTMNRAMANVMRNRYMTDYKIQAVESWLSEFGDMLKTFRENPDRVWANPSYYLHNPDFLPDSQVSDTMRLKAAQASRQAIVNLLGSETPFGSQMRWVQNKLMDSLYEGTLFGQRVGSQKLADSTAAKVVTRVDLDPFRKIRAAAFHMTLGLFNPTQVFLQAQTLGHVLALSPTHAVPGLSAAVLMRKMGVVGEDALDAMAAKAGKLGMKPEWFKESYENLQKTGLWHVEGEHAWKDDMFDPKLFQSTAGSILDKGTVFFKETERMTRLAAWNTAFREFKTANPTKAIDARARAEILSRANLMTMNMTRASSAQWQQGLWSVPTQFMGYQARLTEQLLGKRLTTAEKVRVYGTYAALYGVPTSAGAGLAVYPLYEDIRTAAMERGLFGPNQGIDPMEHPMMKMFMEGIPATLFHAITGEDKNFAERSGPGGIKIFKEVLKGDKGVTDLVFGPSASITVGAFKAVEPLFHLTDAFSDKSTAWTATVDDFVQATQSVSSVNQAVRTIWALNTGKWISKNGVKLDDIKPWSAVFSGMTGTDPHNVSDSYLAITSMKDAKKAQDEAQKAIGPIYKRAIQAFAEGDVQAGANYMRRVNALFIAGGFQENQRAMVFNRASGGIPEDQVDRIARDFMLKAPPSQYKERFNTFTNNGQ